jgi:hypothetical protein
MTALNYGEYVCCKMRGVESWLGQVYKAAQALRLEESSLDCLNGAKVERAVEQFQPRVVIRMPHP